MIMHVHVSFFKKEKKKSWGKKKDKTPPLRFCLSKSQTAT